MESIAVHVLEQLTIEVKEDRKSTELNKIAAEESKVH